MIAGKLSKQSKNVSREAWRSMSREGRLLALALGVAKPGRMGADLGEALLADVEACERIATKGG